MLRLTHSARKCSMRSRSFVAFLELWKARLNLRYSQWTAKHCLRLKLPHRHSQSQVSSPEIFGAIQKYACSLHFWYVAFQTCSEILESVVLRSASRHGCLVSFLALLHRTSMDQAVFGPYIGVSILTYTLVHSADLLIRFNTIMDSTAFRSVVHGRISDGSFDGILRLLTSVYWEGVEREIRGLILAFQEIERDFDKQAFDGCSDLDASGLNFQRFCTLLSKYEIASPEAANVAHIYCIKAPYVKGEETFDSSRLYSRTMTLARCKQSDHRFNRATI
jgi:hypothetical protein